MKNFLAAAGLVIVATTLSVLVGEFLLLRVFLNPAHFLYLDDPILGHRLAPYVTGHDALGFHNARVPERVDVVAVGDSQTYGWGATRENSWPQQLGRLLGQSVYNMALSGYGPVEYMYLVQHETPEVAYPVVPGSPTFRV